MIAHDPLRAMLVRFDVPPLSEGLSERIVRAAASSLPAVRSGRDRRGVWRRGRHALFGTIAFGMLSAAAVASGLLERVGVDIPVLSAMLAPRDRVAPNPPIRVTVRPAPAKVAPVRPPNLALAQSAQPMPPPVGLTLLRAERRERIRAYAEANPRAAALVARRVRQELRRRAMMRRDALGLPPADPLAPDFRPLTFEERVLLRLERRRDRWRAEAMIDRRLAARADRMAVDGAAPDTPARVTNLPATPEPVAD